MRRAVYAGSFDPPTCGHMYVIEAASRLFDELRVVVAKNSDKTPWFGLDERLHMLTLAIAAAENEYRRGRAALLEGLLRRPRIYRTDFFYERCERRARENIAREIDVLAWGGGL